MTVDARRLQVAVIGAGIGGLTAALAFARRGAEVTVHERAPELAELGAGLQITPNGNAVLDALGLQDAVVSDGLRAEAVEPMDALSGRCVARFDLARTAARHPYVFLRRSALQRRLAQAAQEAGAELRLGQTFEGRRKGGALRFSSGEVPAPDLLVGADGVRSKLRGLIGPAPEAQFTGQVAWRAVVKGDSPPVARIWMAPGRHVVTYPLGQGKMNLVAVQERQDWAEEGWHHPDDPANLRHAFGDVAPELRDLLAQVDEVALWGLFRHPVPEVWHDGTAVLLGDAAHPTLPFLAQGANLAIEDAWVLADCVMGKGRRREALDRYQALRRPRVIRAIEAANANARNYHLSGTARQMAHMGLATLARVAPSVFLGRLDWLYGHDVTRAA